MPSLLQVQREFAEQLNVPPLPDSPSEIFRGDARMVRDRLAIYRGNVSANQSKALRGAYPVVAKIVGDEFFDGLAREYGRDTPSISGDLNEFGERFAEFLRSFPHVAALPYLQDVARLEWRVHRAFYAADKDKLDAARLSQVAPDAQATLRFHLHPACAILHCEFPLARIWEIHQDDYQGEFELGADPRSGWVLVQRPQFRVEVSTLRADDAAFLAEVRDGAELESALSSALSVSPEFDLGSRLAAWIAAKVIVDLSSTHGDQDASTR